MARAVRFVSGAFGADTTPFSLLAADRTDLPTAAVVMVSNALTPGTPENSLSLSIGITDFTTTAAVATASRHAQNPTKCAKRHVTGPIVSLLDPSDTATPLTTLRSATVAAVAGGIQLTPGQSGGLYLVRAKLYFEHKFVAINTAGDGSLSTDEVVVLNHTLNGPAQFGEIYSVNQFDDENTVGGISMGMFRDAGMFDEDNPNTWFPSIEQWCMAFRLRSGVTTTDTSGRAITTRVASNCDNSGSEFSGQEVTANGINQIQFTNRTGGAVNPGMIGLISTMSANETHIAFVDAPTSEAADWELTGLAFQPDAMFLVSSMMDSVPFGESSADAASFGFYGVDSLGEEGSLSFADEHGNATASNSQSRADAGLILTGHTGTVTFNLDTVTLTSDGFLCDAADITTANATARKFLAVLFAKPGLPPAPPSTIDRVGQIDGLNVIYDNEVMVPISGSLFTGSGTVTMSDFEVAGAGSGTEVTQPQDSYADGQIVISEVDKGALVGDALWINVTPTAGATASFPIICRADPGAGNMALRATPPAQEGEEGISFSFDAGQYLYAGYLAAEDALTITCTGLPPDLACSPTGVIAGTVGSAAADSSPYAVEATATDLALNEVSDEFVWTVNPLGGGSNLALKRRRRGY